MNPIFSTLSDVQAALRLSGISSETDADVDDLIDLAIRKVRIGFRKRLGHSRIQTIKDYDQSEDPESDQEYMRELAEVTEIDWIRLELTYLLPMLFMDSAADRREVYNEEAPFRHLGQDDLKSLRTKLKNEIESSLEILSGDVDMEDAKSFRVKSIEPDETKTSGDSLNEA